MERNISGIGQEITNYEFKGILDWLIVINDPREIWKAQPTYLLSEFTFLSVGLLTFIHSQRVGGRFRWLWLACLLHGFFVENVTFWTPMINNFWHSQTTVVLLGRRLPLHIPFLYPTFIYTASACVSRLRLGHVSQAVAVGLSVVLIDIPYDIMAVKFVHWTWHDTDVNIFDRHYWVPFTSYYFHATFAATFTFMFHFLRRKLCENQANNQWVSDSRISRELLCTLITAFCGMPGGVLQFLPLYHPLHDYFGIHTENCVIALFLIYFLIAWRKDRSPQPGSASRPSQDLDPQQFDQATAKFGCHWERAVIVQSEILFLKHPQWLTLWATQILRFYLLGSKKGYGITEIVIGLVLHYSCYLGMVLFFDPEYEISVGLHEKIGPCDKWEEQETIFTLVTGQSSKRRKFLCATDYDEKYFDFRCVGNKLPQSGSEWYTICGTPYPNRAEYVQVIGTICCLAFVIFGTMLFSSGPEWETKKEGKSKKK